MANQDSSYRVLFASPQLFRAVASMELGRVTQAMLPVALVLLALSNFESPTLAGALTFLSIFPGLLAAPFVGALIDRFGKVLSIRLDYVTGAITTAVIAALPLATAEVVPVLLALTLVLGVSQLFSEAGFRSLFADLVPSHLWERVNAVDSSGYQIAMIVGSPIAATLFAISGPSITFAVIAVAYAASAALTVGLRDRERAHTEQSHIVRSAIQGLLFVFGNRTLRGMAISVSITGVGLGIVTIAVPVLIVEQLGAGEAIVGLAFAVSGAVGVVAAVAIGRIDTSGRERWLIIGAHAVMAVAALMLLPVATAGLMIGLAWLFAAMALRGGGEGAWDLGVFTLRQRRTDPHMMGRAFAISMALNYSGVPLGAALGGWLIAAADVTVAISAAVAFGIAGTLLAYLLLPRGAAALELSAQELTAQEP